LSLSEDRSVERTDLAEDRTILANERTFAGWMRTGMAAVGIGIAFNALFQKLEPTWLPKAIATLFLMVGIYTFVAAERRASAVLKRLDPHEIETFKPVRLRLMTTVLALATASLAVAIWVFSVPIESGVQR